MSHDLKEEEKETIKIFKCEICGFKERYEFYGECWDVFKGFRFEEGGSFVMKDPFDQSSFLILGSCCSNCRKTVCEDCSVYYTKRFCLDCVQENFNEFPKQIQEKVGNLIK